MTKSIGKEFMKLTRYQFLEESEQSKGEPMPTFELTYNSASLVELPSIESFQAQEPDLFEVLRSRRSVRRYDENSPLTLEEFSMLLWYTQGIHRSTSNATFRFVPSAGARHAFETYVLVSRVEGLKPGLYRYVASKHAVILENGDGDISQKVVDACNGQVFVGTSAATFIWTAVAKRMTWRYGERGYRYLHLDAGHVCQNLYLLAESINAGVCAVAAFDDDKLNKVLSLDGDEHFVVYVGTLGRKLER